MGLLKKQGGSSNWKYLRKALRLVPFLTAGCVLIASQTVEDINEKEPSDIAYVYSGYAPLSVRLIQVTLILSCVLIRKGSFQPRVEGHGRSHANHTWTQL